MLTVLRNVEVKDIHWPLFNTSCPKLFDKSRFLVGWLLGPLETLCPRSIFWKRCMVSLISPSTNSYFLIWDPWVIIFTRTFCRRTLLFGADAFMMQGLHWLYTQHTYPRAPSWKMNREAAFGLRHTSGSSDRPGGFLAPTTCLWLVTIECPIRLSSLSACAWHLVDTR